MKFTRGLCGWPALVLTLANAQPARAQAWTPLQGEGSVTISFQNTFVREHAFGTALQLDRGHIRSSSLIVDFGFGITDKVAVGVSLPYVSSKYTGPYPHPTALDNTGGYHSTFQDVRFDVRWNVSRSGFVITPFVGTIVPSHDYEYFAHSAAGRDLHELQVGTYWAKLLDSVMPGLFVSGVVSYGFAERVLDISHNHSNVGAEVGYFFNPRFRAYAITTAQVTHGGIDFPDPRLKSLSGEVWTHHDQISRDNYLNIGGGAAFTVTPALDVFGSVIHTAAARNIHVLQYAATVGLTWSFMTPHARASANRSPGDSVVRRETRSLIRCVCQKRI